MNDIKIGLIYFKSTSHLRKCHMTQINVNGEQIGRSNKTRYPRLCLDRTFSMKDHVMAKCKVAKINLLWIKAASKFLSRKACGKLMIFLVISHLDYTNGLLVGLPKSTLDQQQQVQNMAAKIVLNKKKYDSWTRCLEELHWIPIQYRTEIKVFKLVFNCLHKQLPSYLKEIKAQTILDN